MKIVHITELYGDGGGGSALTVDSLCTLLESKGHENVVCYGMQIGNPIKSKRKSVEIQGIGDFQVRIDYSKLEKIAKFLEVEKPDVIQFHQNANHHLVNFVCQNYPTALYVYNHSFTCPSGTKYYANTREVCNIAVSPPCLINHYTKRCGTRRPLKITTAYIRTQLMYKACKKVSRLIAISNYMQMSLIEAGYDATKIKVIPSLSPSILNIENTLPDIYPSDNNTLLFVGRITEPKGLEVLISSLPLIKHNWRLVVVGDGYRLPHARKLVETLHLQDRVEFISWVENSEMENYYNNAAIIIVPSIYPDPLVLVGLEAMRYSRPIIAFDVGGIPDWLENGYNGFLCRYQDITDMANKIDILLSDKDRAVIMGKNGKQKLLSDFNPDVIANQFIQCYQEAISVYSTLT